MTKEDPIEHAVDQIVDLLRKTEEEIKKPKNKKMTQDLLNQVESLERQVSFFKEIQMLSVETAKIDHQKLKQIILNPSSSEMSLKSRLLLDRIAKVKQEVVRAKKMFENFIKEGKDENLTTEKKKKRLAQKRLKKFRGVGERQKWKKM